LENMLDKLIRYFFKSPAAEPMRVPTTAPPLSSAVKSLPAPASDIEVRCDQIALDVAAANSEGIRIYGAQFAGIRLGPIAANADVEAFETRYGVRLPEGYRAFVMRVGNGVGDGYLGLVNPLDDELYSGWHAITADFLLVSFPFEAAFSPYPEYEGEPYLAPGTIWLTNRGCGMYAFMVVSGPNAGEVWFDHLVDGYGLVPSGQSFLDWIAAEIAAKIASMRAGKVFNLKRQNGERVVCIK
jgi:SMI1 / KNR4 family (SUKH-1)